MDVTLRLHPPEADDEVYVEWQAEVGFVSTWRSPWPMIVGQVGFMDQFTVTLSRYAAELAIEPAAAYDSRFPPTYLGGRRPAG